MAYQDATVTVLIVSTLSIVFSVRQHQPGQAGFGDVVDSVRLIGADEEQGGLGLGMFP